MFSPSDGEFTASECLELNRVVRALLDAGIDEDEAHQLAADAWIDDADAARMLSTIQSWGHAENARL